ncbi:UNVERIFIED_CONTAM: hypothetical protein RF653_17465 [Kocuria sp. CPCC 205316]|uniref:hypothetical protein n=1 Tax=Kocuria TaxID=57493 RepID=UPI0036D83B75
MQARIAESIALVTIGDGVIAALFPARHAARWVIGPDPVRRILSMFVEHPGLMRAAGVAQVVAGIAWVAALPPRAGFVRGCRSVACSRRAASGSRPAPTKG